jgi:hypothetical protein
MTEFGAQMTQPDGDQVEPGFGGPALQRGHLFSYSVDLLRSTESKVDGVNVPNEVFGLLEADQFFQSAAYSSGKSELAIAERSGASEAADQMTWGTEQTASTSLLNGADACRDIASFVQQKDTKPRVA